MNEDAVLGEIRLWAGSFLPSGWLCCDGSVLPITPSGKSQDPLYAVLKSQFGGDGVKTFALPKLPDVVLPKIVIAEAGNFRELARMYREEVIARGMGMLGAIVARGIENGEFRPLPQ